MFYVFYATLFLLLISITINIVQFLQRKKPQKQVDYDVQALLQDLMSGAALVKVVRISPEDVFLRSTRG